LPLSLHGTDLQSLQRRLWRTNGTVPANTMPPLLLGDRPAATRLTGRPPCQARRPTVPGLGTAAAVRVTARDSAGCLGVGRLARAARASPQPASATNSRPTARLGLHLAALSPSVGAAVGASAGSALTQPPAETQSKAVERRQPARAASELGPVARPGPEYVTSCLVNSFIMPVKCAQPSFQSITVYIINAQDRANRHGVATGPTLL
jgi:hypothetical protein